jgi:hypothetical protein
LALHAAAGPLTECFAAPHTNKNFDQPSPTDNKKKKKKSWGKTDSNWYSLRSPLGRFGSSCVAKQGGGQGEKIAQW